MNKWEVDEHKPSFSLSFSSVENSVDVQMRQMTAEYTKRYLIAPKSNVSSVGPSSESGFSLTKSLYARNVRLHFPYRQYTNFLFKVPVL